MRVFNLKIKKKPSKTLEKYILQHFLGFLPFEIIYGKYDGIASVGERFHGGSFNFT